MNQLHDTVLLSFSRFLTLQQSFYKCVYQKTLCSNPARLTLPQIFRIPKEDKMEVKKGQNSSEKTQQSLPKGAWSTRKCNSSI